MTMTLRAGTRVRLVTPENHRLHGAAAQVVTPTEWGAHVATPAAATGRFRAAHHEMAPVAVVGDGFTGSCCVQCGSARMRRNGACELCEECGATTGCG